MAERRIKRALISVYDKTGIVDFARALVDEFGVEIISTGGTAALLKENGIPVTLVEQITGFPEMLDGRVKTLHPKIHAAILADRDNPEHMRQLTEQGIEPIDMVVVNLYPFEKTVADPNCTFEQAIEMIDIGGPCLLRAAAKNYRQVVPILRKEGLSYVLEELRENGELLETGRMVLASIVYQDTSAYDAKVDAYLAGRWTELRCGPSQTASGKDVTDTTSATLEIELIKSVECHYGENPHQKASLYVIGGPQPSVRASISSTVFPSFNNFVDASSALGLCSELARELSGNVGPTFQSVIRPITEEIHTRRHLPHIQNPESHYFLTFRMRAGTLNPEERSIVLEACRHWHGSKMTLHACVVMPDHVHLVVTPHESASGEWVSLGEILRSIKGFSARRINELRRTSGSLWLDETWDRIIRNEKEYYQRLDYINGNPEKVGLGRNYRWLWINERAWEELAEYYEGRRDRLESRSHTKAAFPFTGVGSVVFVKHTNPCGVGIASDPVEAYRQAYLGDPNAALGGILACSFPIDEAFADAVMRSYDLWGKAAGAGGFFVEVWIAPTFHEKTVEVIRARKEWGKKVRLMSAGESDASPNPTGLEFKSIAGGMLVQTPDLVGLNEDQWKVVTKRPPSESEISDLRLAWLIAKHTKSNAISICKDGMLIGNGAGQMSRVMSCRIATWLAKENGHADKLPGSAAASDAFFPFADGPNILIDAGVSAIIQPGGSKRDAEVIAACDARNVGMIFTGTRHFKH